MLAGQSVSLWCRSHRASATEYSAHAGVKSRWQPASGLSVHKSGKNMQPVQVTGGHMAGTFIARQAPQ